MTTTILSAGCPEQPALQDLTSQLVAELARAGEPDVRLLDVAALRLAYCQGEFDCWIKTPGICRTRDDERDVLRAVHDADRLVLVDGVAFGGHGHAVKRALDRMIPLLLPFFETRAALTHHDARYPAPASLFALGWTPRPDAELVEIWGELTDANAINLLAPRCGAAVVDDTERARWPERIRAMLASSRAPTAAIHGRAVLRHALLDAARPAASTAPRLAPRSAAILVGSAKARGTSASENIAHALAARLTGAGVATEIRFATEVLHDASTGLTAALAAADLLVLVTPLYVDALPALVTHTLELVARRATPDAWPPAFAMVVQCGFPEPEQTRLALRIARRFCAESGRRWAGGLPLGGGGAVRPTPALDQQHGPAEHVKRALDAAAPALARGDDVPAEALELIVTSPLPDALYRVLGNWSWRHQAHRNGLGQHALRDRPLD